MKRNQSETEYDRLVAQETLIFQTGEAIAELLVRQNLTRQALAKRLGKSKAFVTHLLSGRRNMTLRTLADLAFALDHRFELVVRPRHENSGGWPGRQRPLVRKLSHGGVFAGNLSKGSVARGHRCLREGSPRVRTNPPTPAPNSPTQTIDDSVHEVALAG